MKRYIAKRIVYLVLTLFIITTATFFLMKNLPGTPFDEEKLALLTQDQRDQIYASYGLDKPVIVQYVNYIGNIVQGDLGTSIYYTGQDVKDIIVDRIYPSALVGLQAILLGTVIGLILGVLAAYRHNSGWDYAAMIVSVLGVSIPNFVLAALLQYYIGLKWGILPVAFWESYDSSVLPSVALSFGVIAIIARFVRTEMLEVLQQDYIVTAKAKGLGQMAILSRHAVRNSLIPVITILGPIVVNLLTGSLVIENIFGIPGIGSLFVDSIKTNDYATIMGVTIFYSAFYVVVMLLVDILYSLVDPRIRLGSGRE
ncbi:ABC transporter permease [Cohnella thailandensis]|uniref:ABC transporter permease n=1 Tax=Cohnella thailandensis TaxID=557557 RepID=A0A841SUM6_9BACL|nr:ABC transporter permease [Cohnella thailandensis]MBB6633908.1 ABC transporter permease [Cohnella thailandensis]MBP1972591.1 oligopeptide transport system permease protein [Cohnella thailandensis]